MLTGRVSVDELLNNFDQMEHVQKILVIEKLKQMSQLERNLLGLYYFEKLDIRTISGLLGFEESFVRTKLHEIQMILLEEVGNKVHE
jgi:DNA-directed RNA polymerase specialized sigma subunit